MAKKPTTAKKDKKAPRTTDKAAAEKTPKAAKASAAPKIFNNDDPEAKALFLHHLNGKDGKGGVRALKAAVGRATADLRNAYKTAKAQGGFEKADFDSAFELETAEQEAKARAKIARKLQIARYMGSDLGAQMELFLEPVRTPAADRAFNEGQTAAMSHQPAKPVYAPETEQFRKYMEGYHSVQGDQVKEGIGKLHPEVEADTKETAAQKAKTKKQREADAKEFEAKEEAAPVTSGVAMTRAEFEAAQQSSHFTKN